MNYIIPLEDFLFESKRTAKETYLDKGLISEETFNEFLDIDTTPTKKFIDSMCKFFVGGSDKEQIISIFQQAIPMFIRNIIKVDIKSIKSLEELKGLIEEKQDYKTRSEIREEARDGATVVYEDENQKVYLIETKEASIIYGKGTEWCTSSEISKNYFNDYYHKRKLTLYYILSKVRPQSDPLYKVAIVVPPKKQGNVESTWDSNDKEIDFYKIINKLGLNERLFKYVKDRRERVYEIEDFIVGDYNINDRDEVDVYGSVYIDEKLTEIPFKFGRVSKNFYCNGNKLTTLKNCPTFVGGEFNCSDNLLTSLEGCPTFVGGEFNCVSNRITSLIYSPVSLTDNFKCSHNLLTSLDGCPLQIGGSFMVGAQKNRYKFKESQIREICKVGGKVYI
jgi:hypothetical protein